MSLFSEVEKNLDLRFRKWTQKVFGASESGDLVLLWREILDEVLSKVQMVRPGERVFPYHRLHVRLIAATRDRRDLLAAAFGEGRLQTDVAECLAGSGCEVPAGFSLDIETTEAGAKPFEIVYQLRSAPVEHASLQIVGGDTVLMDRPNTNIGRVPEVADHRDRVVRRNDIVLKEDAVSRAHAHIVFNAEAGEYRIYDDASEHGTRIVRSGRSIEVPPGYRGERLKAGDEIYLGRAVLRFL
jgi:hypothetical protein